MRENIATVAALCNTDKKDVDEWCVALKYIADKFTDADMAPVEIEDDEAMLVEEDSRPKLVMHDWQQRHHDDLSKSLATYGRAVDRSRTGTGKTLVALELSRLYDTFLVVHPAGLGFNWAAEARRQGIVFGKEQSFTWHGVSGTKAKGGRISHPYLTRQEVQVDNTTNTNQHNECVIQPTDKFRQLLAKKRVLVIFDEVHDGTNGGARTKATAVLAKTLFNGQTKEPFRHGLLVLSGTMMWNKACMTPVMQLLGYLPPQIDARNRLFTSTKSTLGTHALMHSHLVKPLEDMCRFIDDKKTTDVHDKYIKFGYHTNVQSVDGERRPLTTQERADSFVFHCFLDVLMPHLSSAMVNPRPPPLQVRNLFALFTNASDLQAYQDALRGVRTAVDGQRNKQYSVAQQQQCRNDAFLQIHKLEFSKGPLFVRHVIETLQKNPMCKVHVALNYTDTLKYVVEHLQEWSPLVISGDKDLAVPTKKRTEIFERFQDSTKDAHGNLLDRLLIANIKMVGQGVNLDDTTGDHPRFMFAAATYHILLMKQWEERGARTSSRGNCTVTWIYARPTLGDLEESSVVTDIEEEYERKIMVSLADKSEVLGLLADEQVKSGMVFFDKYECWQEWRLGEERRVSNVDASTAVLFERKVDKMAESAQVVVKASAAAALPTNMEGVKLEYIKKVEASQKAKAEQQRKTEEDKARVKRRAEAELERPLKIPKHDGPPRKSMLVYMSMMQKAKESRNNLCPGPTQQVKISSGVVVTCCLCDRDMLCETQLRCETGKLDWQRARAKLKREEHLIPHSIHTSDINL